MEDFFNEEQKQEEEVNVGKILSKDKISSFEMDIFMNDFE